MTDETKKLQVVWKRHKSPKSLATAFTKGMGLKPSDLRLGHKEGETIVQAVEREKIWAFVDKNVTPPVVHYWYSSQVPMTEVAFVLGHELGHLSGKPLKSWREEPRANEYGDVAALVFSHLQRRSRR